ncbi:MAG: DNA polymerase III subunit chi [Desulforhabdus sp.]|nr:DNA polymerase III subunit chi [Desulforhabdus sp.]
MGTTIIFVETPSGKKRDVLCRWVEHFYEAGNKIQVSVDSTIAAQHIDQLLWTFSQGSFIPHKIVSGSDAVNILEPVAIKADEKWLEGFQVLIADGSFSLHSMNKCGTAVHFVLLDDPEKRQESRLLWQAAKERGFQLRHVPYSASPKSIAHAGMGT